MDLPREYIGGVDCGLDSDAIEHLLTVHEFLHLLYTASKPNQTSYQKVSPGHLNGRRSLQRLVDWKLLTLQRAPTPENPRRISQTLTPDGVGLAVSYAREVSRLLKLAAPSSPSPNAD
jgi:hypothetical protein